MFSSNTDRCLAAIVLRTWRRRDSRRMGSTEMQTAAIRPTCFPFSGRDKKLGFRRRSDKVLVTQL
ncbi:hypothetical protein HanPSC8_Chr11g0485131 [Helianthus annuus]|nr:hypothetical protein HanPSC8_Chr11g0485131 [Helianthus annuus]